MKKFFKLLTVVLSAALIGAAAVGCTPAGVNPGGDEIVKAEYEIDFDLPASTSGDLTVIIPDNDTERKIMNALIAGFNEMYPNVKVTMNFLAIDSYNSTIMRQYQADVLADIMWTNSSNYYFLVSNGFALNMDLFIDQAEDAGLFVYEEDFNEEFQGMGEFDGIRYAIPRSIDSVICFYNKDILNDAGVDLSVIQNGWSWDTLMECCEKVRAYYDKNGDTTYFPLDSNITWESVAYPIIKSLGGEVLNENGEFVLTEEKAQEVIDFVQYMVEKRYIPSGSEQTSSFESATGAFLFQSTSIDNYQTRATLRNKFDVVSFPLINGEDSYSGMGFAGYAFNSKLKDDADQLNIAAAFMAYLMSFEGQQRVAGEGGLTLPSIRTDLGTDNPDANWHKTYSSQFNVEAYTYGSQYKIGIDFINGADPIFATDLINALNTFVGSSAVRRPDDAYQTFKDEVEYVFNSQV